MLRVAGVGWGEVVPFARFLCPRMDPCCAHTAGLAGVWRELYPPLQHRTAAQVRQEHSNTDVQQARFLHIYCNVTGPYLCTYLLRVLRLQ